MALSRLAPHFIQRYSAALSSAVILIGVVVAIVCEVGDLASIVSVAGVALSLIYFYQSQKLEQTRLLKDLVTDFNARYDTLNDALNDIVEKKSTDGEKAGRPLRDYLNDYFNLCAEEYLFFKRGYIPPEVWNSWLYGMQYYYNSGNPIAQIWQEEMKSGSYYGFTLDMIRSVPAK